MIVACEKSGRPKKTNKKYGGEKNSTCDKSGRLKKLKNKTKNNHLEYFHFSALRDGSHDFVFAEAVLPVTVDVVAMVAVAAERQREALIHPIRRGRVGRSSPHARRPAIESSSLATSSSLGYTSEYNSNTPHTPLPTLRPTKQQQTTRHNTVPKQKGQTTQHNKHDAKQLNYESTTSNINSLNTNKQHNATQHKAAKTSP